MSEQPNIEQLCEQYGVSPDAVRVRWNRRLREQTGEGFDRFRVPTEQERAVLFANKSASAYANNSPKAKKMRTPVREQKRVSLEPVPSPNVAAGQSEEAVAVEAKTPLIGSLLDAILFGVVLGHAILIAVECGQIWATPGAIGGGVSLLIILAALLLSADPAKPRTSETALYFVLLVDVLAWWVHFNAMRTETISDTITGVFCGVLCACSWVSLFLYRDSKLI